MLHTCSRFLHSRSGNVVMIFALVLPVMLLAIGGAIDFGRMMQLKKEMQDAADVASLGSIAVNSSAYKEKNKGDDDDAKTQGVLQAKAIFDSNMPAHDELSKLNVSTRVTSNNGLLTSNVRATALYKPYILGLMQASFPISVASIASSTTPPFIDFYLLLDNSPSMGLGATYDDIDKLMSNSKSMNEGSCAFSCHESGANAGKDYYTLAKKLGITMRIDVVRQATQNMMATAKNTETIPNQYRMAIYHFGMAADKIDLQNPVAYEVSSLTTDLDVSAKNAAAIDLMTIPNQNYNSDRQTNFKSVFQNMNTIIPTPGDGTSSAKPQKVLFFVSDGATDAYDCSASGCRRLGPMDKTTCTAIKARGIRIAVLYTTYLRLEGKYYNAWYDANMDKYIAPTDTLSQQMQACASPGLFFEVAPNQGISEAMSALFKKVISVVRINS